MNNETTSTTGFDSINNAVSKIYPNQDGHNYRTMIPYMFGGNDPLDSVQVMESEKSIPHWHYITYGFTELYEKESDYLEESGYGFELTFRLAKGDETEPPTWVINFLQNLARYVFSTGNGFGIGHHMNCNGPIALETDTKLTAIGFRLDTELGEMDTNNGHVKFLQVVAITEDEMNAMMCWSGEKFLEEMDKYIPLCITDLKRNSQMENPNFRKAWQEGMEKDGSSTAFLYIDELGTKLDNDYLELRLGAGHINTLMNMLFARVGKGKSLYLNNGQNTIKIESGDNPKFAIDDEEDILVITLTKENLTEMKNTLQPHADKYKMFSLPMTVELIPTKIKDSDGNVLKVIE